MKSGTILFLPVLRKMLFLRVCDNSSILSHRQYFLDVPLTSSFFAEPKLKALFTVLLQVLECIQIDEICSRSCSVRMQ